MNKLKKPILLLHGALGNSSQLDILSDKLKEEFTIYSLNFDGHGGRPISGDYSIDLFVENVLEYLNEKSIQSIDVFGYSMGGYVALALANKYPNRVKSIVTYGTKFDWNPISAQKEIEMLDPSKIEEKVPKFAHYLKAQHAPLDWKKVLIGTAEMILKLGDGNGLKDQELQSIKNRVLIGIGDQDQMVSIEESTRISNLLPSGQLKIYQGFIHPIDKIDLELLTAEIILFFSIVRLKKI